MATVLLGINQGLAWSMTQTSKLDLTTPSQRGLVVGLNEFVGYTGMAIAGLLSAKLTAFYGIREGLFLFGTAMIGFAGLMSIFFIKDTMPWAKNAIHHTPIPSKSSASKLGIDPSIKEIFMLMVWHDKRMLAISQAGLVEKFVDALIWAFFPIYLYDQKLSLENIAWVISIYGITWGVFQLLTGYLSDIIGRKIPITLGMIICGSGVILSIYAQALQEWAICSAIMGLGMALLYPTLLAAISDISEPHWRGNAIGMYRFIRDLGYGIGAVLLGLIATVYVELAFAFWFTGISMLISGVLFFILFEETHVQDHLAKD
jgi:MFS family permease